MKNTSVSAAAFAAFLATPALALDCADGQRAFIHAAGETCIPGDPQRIVSLHDLTITLPLVELGVTDRIVGSMGRQDGAGDAASLASVPTLFGVDFANTDMTFVGVWEYDLERIASLEPDLIVARPSEEEIAAQLSAIAPTVLLDPSVPQMAFLENIADMVGAQDRHDELRLAYEARLTRLKGLIDAPEQVNISVAYTEPGWIGVYDTFYALTHVASELGLGQGASVSALFDGTEEVIDHATSKEISAEAITSLDADLMFLPYWSDDGARNTPDGVRAAMEGILPGWCDFFEACAADQIVYFEATPTYAVSFTSFDAAIALFERELVGRDLIEISD